MWTCRESQTCSQQGVFTSQRWFLNAKCTNGTRTWVFTNKWMNGWGLKDTLAHQGHPYSAIDFFFQKVVLCHCLSTITKHINFRRKKWELKIQRTKGSFRCLVSSDRSTHPPSKASSPGFFTLRGVTVANRNTVQLWRVRFKYHYFLDFRYEWTILTCDSATEFTCEDSV